MILAGRVLTLLLCLLSGRLAQSAVMEEFVAAMDEISLEKQRAAANQNLQRALLRVATPRHLSNNNNDDANAAGDDDASTSSNSIDLTKYALKYIGCSNIKSWSDDEAMNANSDSPLMMNRFVILRLCEADTCSAYNHWGCNGGYGEYMIPMEDYLQIMFNHHTTQFGYYCNICQKCMNYNSGASSYYSADDSSSTDDEWSGYNKYWGVEADDGINEADDGINDDGNNAAAAGDDYYADDVVIDDLYNRRERKLANNQQYSSSNSQPAYISGNGTCIYESVCSRYRSACQNVPQNSGIEQYFSCGKFAIGNNGNYGYIGPHCQSDGRTIDIGFYADESCNNFAGDSQNLKNYFSIEDKDMNIYFSQSCLPCTAADAFALVADDELENGEIYSLCSALYEPAAKCQKAFSNRKSSYETSQQEQNEGAVCSMIESLVTNTYDEFGDPVVLEDFNFHQWKQKSEYVKLVRKASPVQISLLVVSVLVTLALALYAVYLHKKLFFRKPWTPPTVSGYGNFDTRSYAGRISRVQSGIVANRTGISIGDSSQTGGQPYPRQSNRSTTSNQFAFS